MDLNLRGRTAIVTGGSKGIGAAIARELAGEGCNLHLAARSEADLAKLRDELRAKHNVRVEIHALDLAKSADVATLATAAADAEILINNAGAIPAGTIETVDEQTWRQAWDLKVFGYINLCRAMYAEMKKRGRGTMINVIGAAGERQDFKYVAGSAGNASLMAFTRAVGSDSTKDKIRVVAINPGYIVTERMVNVLRKRMTEAGENPDLWESKMANMPWGRGGRPDEIAGMAAFLASDRASYISGTVITIDGGWSARAPLV